MTLKTNDAEGGTDGVATSTGNSGGASGTAWDIVNINAGSTFHYESTGAIHGTMSYQVSSTTTATNPLAGWTDTAANQAVARVYMSFTTMSTVNNQQFGINFRSGSGSLARSEFNTDGTFRGVMGATNSSASALALSTGTVYRMEAVATGFNGASGALTINVYVGESGTVFTSISLSGATTAAQCSAVRFGKHNTSGNVDALYDSIAADIGSSTLLGPVATNATATPAVINATTNVFDTFTVVIDTDPQPATILTPAASMPAPTVVATQSATITPAVIAATAVLEAAQVNLSYNTSPATVDGSTTMDAVAIAAGAGVSPATIDAPATLPAPALTISDTTSPATIAPPVSSLPAPTVSAGQTVTAAAITPPVVTMPAPTVDTGTNATVNGVTIDSTSTLPAPTVSADTNAAATPAVIDGVSTLPAPTLTTDQIVVALAILGVTTMDAPDVDGGALVTAVTIAGATTMDAVTTQGGSIVFPTIISPAAPTMDAPTLLVETIVLATLISPPAPVMDTPSVQTAGNATVNAVAILGMATLPSPDSIQSGTDAIVPASLIAPGVSTIGEPSILAGQGAFPPVDTINASTEFFDPTVSGGSDALVTAALISPASPTMDAPTVTVTSSAFITAVTVDGTTNFFAPVVVAETAALVTPVVIDGQTSFPEPSLQTDSILSPATVTPSAPTIGTPGIQTGAGIVASPDVINGTTDMSAPSLSTSSIATVQVVDAFTSILVPTVRATNRFPIRMSLKKTRPYKFTVDTDS